MKVLRSFSNAHPHTRLNLFFGNLFGPNELLLDGEVDLIIHHIDTKKEVIVQGMGWGHMPLFLIEEEVNKGRLISIAGKYIKGVHREIVIARLSAPKKGVMAERLWQSF